MFALRRIPRFVLALLLALAPAIAHAEDSPPAHVALPATPAGERLIEFFAVIAADDDSRTREFIDRSIASAWQERASKHGLFQYLRAITDSCASFTTVAIDSSADHSIVVTARARRGGGLKRIALGTEDEPPFRITHLEVGRVSPAPAPAPAPPAVPVTPAPGPASPGRP